MKLQLCVFNPGFRKRLKVALLDADLLLSLVTLLETRTHQEHLISQSHSFTVICTCPSCGTRSFNV